MDKRKVNIESKNIMDAHWRNYHLTGPFQQEFCTSQDVADRNNQVSMPAVSPKYVV